MLSHGVSVISFRHEKKIGVACAHLQEAHKCPTTSH